MPQLLTQWLPIAGAFSLGALIGWFIYSTNRYRREESKLTDVASLISAIAGAGIVTLVDGDGELPFASDVVLFGAYGLGLWVGFLSYFLVLVRLVHASEAFTWTWFLDGRRLDPEPGTSIPGEAARTIWPVSAARHLSMQSMPETGGGARSVSPKDEAKQRRDDALNDIIDSLVELDSAIAGTADQNLREQLIEKRDELSKQQGELAAIQVREIVNSDEVKQALASLKVITAELTTEAGKLKQATDIFSGAAKVVGAANKVIGAFNDLNNLSR